MDLSRPSSPTKSVRVKSSVTTSLRKTQSQTSTTPSKPQRPVSPTRRAKLSPPTARITAARPQTPKSTPQTPEPRLRSLTNTGPVPLHHALSFSSLQPSPKLPGASSPPVRITSKVSRGAKSVLNESAPTQSATRSPTAAAPRHTRTGSASSSVASPPIFYPITTATPAANPFRYAPPRPPVHKHAFPFVAAVKALDVPPPLSPPISSISISSHSSVSYSSNKADSSSPEPSPTALSHVPPLNDHRHSSSSDSHEYDWAEDDDSDEHKEKAAAKSNRKIADLEITNQSLMTINASLEATKSKQSKEIRELRRKLRESRLILPPRAYQSVQSSLDHDDTADEDEDVDDEEDAEGADDTFARVKAMLDNLLETGRRALDTKVADFGGAGSTTKVLSPEEVLSWRRISVEGEEADEPLGPPLSPSRIAVPNSSDDELSMSLDEDALSPSSPPPIFVTHSP